MALTLSMIGRDFDVERLKLDVEKLPRPARVAGLLRATPAAPVARVPNCPPYFLNFQTASSFPGRFDRATKLR
jgi:hypothetical protein